MIPVLAVRDVDAALDFYREAFAAEVLSPAAGTCSEAEIRVGDEHIRVSGEAGTGKSADRAGTVVLNVGDKSAAPAFDRAVEAGAVVTRPLTNLSWTDQYGLVRDPFGHHWAITTNRGPISPQGVRDNVQALFGQRSN